MAHWLDKHIKEQEGNRRIIDGILKGRNAGMVQELAERHNWDKPKRK